MPTTATLGFGVPHGATSNVGSATQSNGEKFRLDRDVTVTRLRVFCHYGDTLSLWLWRVSDQALIASVVRATSATAAGWNEFTVNVALTANTDYILSATGAQVGAYFQAVARPHTHADAGLTATLPTETQVGSVSGPYDSAAFPTGSAFNQEIAVGLVAVYNSPPTAPGTPTVTPNPVNTTGTIAWPAASDPDGDALTYDVELSLDNGGTWRVIATNVGGTSTTYNFGPEPSTTAARVRVRAKDTAGLFGPYATSANFTIQHNQAPTAATGLTPSGNTSVNRAQQQRLSWLFNDPDAGDSQSKFDLDYRVGSGAFTRVTQTTTATFYDAPANLFPAGTVEWLVRPYDSQGVAAPFSSSAFFVAADVPGVPIITSPPNNSTIPSASSVLAWSAPTQEAYQVRTVADNAGAPNTAIVYSDTGTVVSSTARDAPLSFPVNGRTEHAQVRIRNAGLWSDWASVRLVISYTPPAQPTVTLAVDNGRGSITVTPTHPAPTGGQPTVASTRVHRRLSSDDGGAGVRIATGLAASVSYVDFTPASGVDYAYRVEAVGSNGTSTFSEWTSVAVGTVAPVVATAYDGGY